MNPLLARFIACVAVCLPLAILVAMVTTQGKKRVEIQTNGPTADVVAAIEALDRSDLELRLSPPALSGPGLIAVIGTLGMAGGLWIVVSVVISVERFVFKWRK